MTPRRLRTVIKYLTGEMTQLLNGRRKNPSLEILERLARALGVPTTELLE